ncbi:MAG: hypothetical protein K2I83_04375, partial [Bacteroidales bacterium]|nr:hypothetical protein [Bacteroidales bacterium]
RPAIITPAPSPSQTSYTIKPVSAPNITTTYTVRVTANGTNFDKNAVFTIKPAPAFSVNVTTTPNSPLEVCPNVAVTFTASTSGATLSDVTYLWGRDANKWSTGNNKLSFTAISDSNTYAYKAFVTAKGTNGCWGTAESDAKTLTVKPLPSKPGINPMDPMDVCANVDETITPTVAVDATTGVTHTYTWYYTTGGTNPTTSSQSFVGKDLKLCHNGANCATNVGVNMATSGTIKAALRIVSTLNGCSVDSMGPVVTITVNPKPSCSATVTDKTICAGESHTFVPTGLSPDPTTNTTYTYEYRWTPASDATTGTLEANNRDYTVGSDAAATANKTNNYTFVFKVTTDKGCYDSVIKTPTLKVNARTKVSITKDLADAAACEGASVSLAATTSGATKYEWYKSSTATGTFAKQASAPNAATWTFNPVATTDAGFYKLLAFNTANCADSAWSAVKELTVHPKPVKPVIADMTAVNFCQGETGK